MAEVGLGEEAASESIVRHEAAGICLFYSHITSREVLHTGHNRHKPRKLTKSKKQMFRNPRAVDSKLVGLTSRFLLAVNIIFLLLIRSKSELHLWVPYSPTRLF